MSANNQPIIVKKVIHAAHGHHGGSWKVAYADFMTSMLALFIVLWVIGQSKQTRQAIAEYFKDPSKTPAEIVALIQSENSRAMKVANPSLPPIEAQDKKNLEALRKKLEEALKTIKTDDGREITVRVEWSDDGLRITLLDRDKAPFFDVGSVVPKSHTNRVLRVIGRDLGVIPNPVVIEGHTDRRQFTADANSYGNWELSTERGNAARRLLISGGLRADRVQEVRGYADKHLLHPYDPFSPENRRVSILVCYMNNLNGDREELRRKLRNTNGSAMDPSESGSDDGSAGKKPPAAKTGEKPAVGASGKGAEPPEAGTEAKEGTAAAPSPAAAAPAAGGH